MDLDNKKLIDLQVKDIPVLLKDWLRLYYEYSESILDEMLEEIDED
uniref:Uncharacterized protein n=2 Tax=viral metagenome TaxID=1070528 RepID=A0A6M3LU54_9ZZZZ